MNELWIQDKVSKGVISIVKIKNKLNPTDLRNKNLFKDEIAQIVDALCHEFSEGRNQDAPELAMVSDIMDWSMVKQTMFALKLCGLLPVDERIRRRSMGDGSGEKHVVQKMLDGKARPALGETSVSFSTAMPKEK